MISINASKNGVSDGAMLHDSARADPDRFRRHTRGASLANDQLRPVPLCAPPRPSKTSALAGDGALWKDVVELPDVDELYDTSSRGTIRDSASRPGTSRLPITPALTILLLGTMSLRFLTGSIIALALLSLRTEEVTQALY